MTIPGESITDVRISWPSPGEVVDVLSLAAGHNTALVVAGTAMLGIASGTIGAFALLRKRALMGDALSHATLPGIVLAFLIASLAMGSGKNLGVLLIGGAATGVLAMVLVQAVVRSTRLREDAVIGAVLSVFFGLGVVLLSAVQSMPQLEPGGLARFIYGQTASMSANDATVLAIVAGCTLVAGALLHKEFALVCFDDQYAVSQGWPVSVIDLLMMALIVLVVVVGLQAVGLILVVAMLIIPPAAARFWTERLGMMVVLAGVIGGISGYLGSAASALLERLPAGSVIVLTAGAIFLVSMLIAPRRGVVAEGVRRFRSRIEIGMDHALRAIDERFAARPAEARRVVTTHELARDRGWTLPTTHAIVWILRLRGLARAREGRVELTEAGGHAAARVTRRHRLWEQYLVTHADVAASHVDISADLAEHALTPELIAQLEAALDAQDDVPSPHPLAGEGRGDE